MLNNRFTVLIDACVLVPALKRDILLSFAHKGLFRARWSQEILKEAQRGIVKDLTRRDADDPQAAAEKKY